MAGCGGGGGGNNNRDNSPGAANPSDNVVVATAMLTGAQQSPAATTSATGYGSFAVDPATKVVSGEVSYTGITATASHIHLGGIGASGAPVVTLTVDNVNRKASVPQGATLTQAQYDEFVAGNLYVNLHSVANPAGEIRGQIGRFVATAILTGEQEVPAVTTAATGTALFAVDPTTRNLSGHIDFRGMTATASHIHAGAAGTGGAPVVTLTLSGNSATVPEGTVLTAEQLADLLDGKFYVNVHSAAYAAGEIRGQLGPVAVAAKLDGSQEAPSAVATSATGSGVVVVDPVTHAVTGGITFSGIHATAAHIHTGPIGNGGSVIVGLELSSDGISATVPAGTVLTQAQYDDLLNGGLYFNVHSAANPAGEIRGQIDMY
jgi:hypothetical protein